MYKGDGEFNSLTHAPGWTASTAFTDLSLLGLWGVWAYRNRTADRRVLMAVVLLFLMARARGRPT